MLCVNEGQGAQFLFDYRKSWNQVVGLGFGLKALVHQVWVVASTHFTGSNFGSVDLRGLSSSIPIVYSSGVAACCSASGLGREIVFSPLRLQMDASLGLEQ